MTIDTLYGPLDFSKYEKLVHQMAWRCARRLPKRSILEQADLAQEGWLALARAAKTYRPPAQGDRPFIPGVKQAGASFITYAYVVLARRYSEITRREHARIALDHPLLDLRHPVMTEGYEDGLNAQTFGTEQMLETLSETPATQELVETRLDLAQGRWDGPPLRTRRQVEQAQQWLAAVVA